jgi:hypothetical protein
VKRSHIKRQLDSSMTSRFSHSCNQSKIVVISADDFKFFIETAGCVIMMKFPIFFPLFYMVGSKPWFLTLWMWLFDDVSHFFSLTVNIRKPLKHEYITHLRNCFTSPKASRLDGFVVPRRSPSYYLIINPKQKIVNYYELKVVSSFFLTNHYWMALRYSKENPR